MATSIGIISAAFILLGQKPVSSPLTDNPEFAAAQDVYDLLLPDMLTVHTWRFASTTLQLSKSTEESPFDRWNNVFFMPGGQLISYRTDPTTNFEIYQNKLYTNKTSIKLEYVFKVSEANFPPYFTRLMAFQLAADIAMTVTQDFKIAAFWEKKAEMLLLSAKFRDSTIQPNPVPQRDEIYQAHFATGRITGGRFS